ncbi:hypothetical protein Ciccas_012623, partial [Cichlidogyrus casuarinus]
MKLCHLPHSCITYEYILYITYHNLFISYKYYCVTYRKPCITYAYNVEVVVVEK